MAVTLNAEFLRGVPYFAKLEAQIIATLVLCLRSRIYMPLETILHQGEIGQAAAVTWRSRGGHVAVT